MTYLQNGPQQVLGVSVTFFILTWLIVRARCYVRAVTIKKFESEGWLALASLVSSVPSGMDLRANANKFDTQLCYTLYCAFLFDGALHGFGRLSTDITAEATIRGFRVSFYDVLKPR